MNILYNVIGVGATVRIFDLDNPMLGFKPNSLPVHNCEKLMMAVVSIFA